MNYMVRGTNHFGSTDLVFTGGYSYNQINTTGTGFSLGDFPDNTLDYSDAIQNSQDLLNDGYVGANSYASPDEKIIAFFGRINLTFNKNIFFNASLRQEGSSKLGDDNKWGLFPSVGAGADFNSIFDLGLDQLKVRVGYGTTGSLTWCKWTLSRSAELCLQWRRFCRWGDHSRTRC